MVETGKIGRNNNMVVHFDEGKFHIGVYSGRHTITLCGIYLQDRHKDTVRRKTMFLNEVTCKRCLKRIQKRKNKNESKKI